MMGRSGKLETACRDFEEDLVLYYYGEGSGAERSRVESHVKACSRCSRFWTIYASCCRRWPGRKNCRNPFGIITTEKWSASLPFIGSAVLGGEAFLRPCAFGWFPLLGLLQLRCSPSLLSLAKAVGVFSPTDRSKIFRRRS